MFAATTFSFPSFKLITARSKRICWEPACSNALAKVNAILEPSGERKNFATLSLSIRRSSAPFAISMTTKLRRKRSRFHGSETGWFSLGWFSRWASDRYVVTVALSFVSDDSCKTSDCGEILRAYSSGVRFRGSAVTMILRLSAVHAICSLRRMVSDTFRKRSCCRSQIHNLAWPPSTSERKARKFPSGDHTGNQWLPPPGVNLLDAPVRRSTRNTSVPWEYHSAPVRKKLPGSTMPFRSLDLTV